MRKAIIFDLDGTLWNTTGQVYKVWNRVLEKHPEISKRFTFEESCKFMGPTVEEIGALMFPEQDAAFQKKMMEEICAEEVIYFREYGAVIFDGLRETIEALKKDYDLYIVSNCQDGYVECFLEAHGFTEDFKDIEMSGRTGKNKGENIRLLMERNHITNAIYVGDTEGDEKAARAAQIPFVYASYGFGKAAVPDRVIHSIKELPEVVREMEF